MKSLYRKPRRSYTWTCGHQAGHCCAECHRQLADKSTKMVEIIDDLLDTLRSSVATQEHRGMVADAQGRKLNELLSSGGNR